MNRNTDVGTKREEQKTEVLKTTAPLKVKSSASRSVERIVSQFFPYVKSKNKKTE